MWVGVCCGADHRLDDDVVHSPPHLGVHLASPRLPSQPPVSSSARPLPAPRSPAPPPPRAAAYREVECRPGGCARPLPPPPATLGRAPLLEGCEGPLGAAGLGVVVDEAGRELVERVICQVRAAALEAGVCCLTSGGAEG